MSVMPPLFVAAALLTAALATIGVWAPRKVAPKVLALILGGCFLPLGYMAMSDLLSRPKPVDFEWAMAAIAEATVLSSQFREGEGIYLWLGMKETPEPRSFVMAWSLDAAKELQQAQREAEESGGRVMMRLPFEPSLDDREPRFYATPQPAPLPKGDSESAPGPMLYDRPSSDA